MKTIKPYDYSYLEGEELVRVQSYGESETWVRLDPDERVINIERVRGLVLQVEESLGLKYSGWDELKKELGLE